MGIKAKLKKEQGQVNMPMDKNLMKNKWNAIFLNKFYSIQLGKSFHKIKYINEVIHKVIYRSDK